MSARRPAHAARLLAIVAIVAIGLAAAPAPASGAGRPDAAGQALRAQCEEEGRIEGRKARFVFVAGPERAAAVDALARALGGRVERVDVGVLATAYAAEAEANLNRVILPDTRSSVVLFFDEADALFGTPGACPPAAGQRPGACPPAAREALIDRLDAAARQRVVVVGLRERPLVGRLGKRSLAALPAAPTPPWVAVCPWP